MGIVPDGIEDNDDDQQSENPPKEFDDEFLCIEFLHLGMEVSV